MVESSSSVVGTGVVQVKVPSLREEEGIGMVKRVFILLGCWFGW